MAVITFPTSPSLNQTYAVGYKTWIWNGYAWDLQIANASSSGSASNTSIGENTFTANGSQTSFTLTSSVTQDAILVFVSGVLQPNSYYTVVGSNTTITLADAPAANDTVVVKKFTGAGGGSSSGGASVSVSDAPPTSPTANSLWWQSNTGILKIYYTDVDSSQWVDASPPPSSDSLSPFLLMGA